MHAVFFFIMHLSMYSPTTPPSGLSGALLGALTQNFCSTMGHLTSGYVKSPPHPHVATGAHWGFDILCLPHCGEFDIRVCQIPTIAPYNPEGGVVGEYIDKCINFTIGF